MSGRRNNFYVDGDDRPLPEPTMVYSSGAGEVLAAGVDHKTVLTWCVPPAYQCGDLGAPMATVTVRVRIEDPGDEDATVDFSDVFATIAWGSGVMEGPDAQIMDFDVVGGGSVSVEAWSLQVKITYPGTPSAARPRIHVDVSVGLGASGKAGGTSSATRTVKVGDVAGGGNASTTFPIPMYAVSARLINTDAGAIAPSLDFRQKLNAAIATFVSVARIGKLLPDAAPVARGLGARFFDLLNNNAAQSSDTAVVFDLQPN